MRDQSRRVGLLPTVADRVAWRRSHRRFPGCSPGLTPSSCWSTSARSCVTRRTGCCCAPTSTVAPRISAGRVAPLPIADSRREWGRRNCRTTISPLGPSGHTGWCACAPAVTKPSTFGCGGSGWAPHPGGTVRHRYTDPQRPEEYPSMSTAANLTKKSPVNARERARQATTRHLAA